MHQPRHVGGSRRPDHVVDVVAHDADIEQDEVELASGLGKTEATYRLTDSALVWSNRGVEGRLPFSDIRQVRIYRTPGVGFGGATFAPGFQRCVVRPHSGRAQVLSSNHYAGPAKIEDRSASFQPFVDALIRRVATANPGTAFISGMPAALWSAWAVLLLVVVMLLAPLALLVIVITLTQGHLLYGLLTTVLLLGILLALVLLVRFLLRNRPRRFDPRDAGRRRGGGAFQSR
jgi:hypothetical protein